MHAPGDVKKGCASSRVVGFTTDKRLFSVVLCTGKSVSNACEVQWWD